MKKIVTATRHTGRWTVRLIALAALLMLIAIGAGRVLLPKLGDYRAEVETGLADFLKMPVRIQALDAEWEGWNARLDLTDVELLDAETGNVVAAFESSEVLVDVPGTLISRRLSISHVDLSGVELEIQRDEESGLIMRPARSTGKTQAVPIGTVIDRIGSISSFSLSDGRVSLPAPDGSTLEVENIRIGIGTAQDTRELTLAANIAGSPDQRISGLARMQRAEGKWGGNFRIQASAIDLAALPIEFKPGAGIADLSVEGQWHDARLLGVQGEVQAAKFELPTLEGSDILNRWLDQYDIVAAAFELKPESAGWVLKTTLNNTVDGAVDLRYFVATGEDAARLEGEVREPNLELMSAMVSLVQPNLQPVLEGLAPTAIIPKLIFSTAVNAPQTEHKLDVEVRDYSHAAHAGIPGVSGISAQIKLDQNGGKILIDSGSGAIHLDKLFPSPLAFETIAGELQWANTESGVTLSSDGVILDLPAGRMNLQGSALLDGASPVLDLKVSSSAVDIAQVRNYLPTLKLKPKVAAWLTPAFVGGTADEVELSFRGRPADFPFDDGSGEFKVRIHVQNGILDYFKQWPRIEEIEAEVLFHNRSLTVNAVDGRIFDGRIKQATAYIENLKDSYLTIEGSVDASSADLVRFVDQSPLAKSVGPKLSGIRFSGDNTLDLKLDMPFHQKPIEATGAIHFNGGSLALEEWGLDLANVRGKVDFTQRGISAKGLRLAMRGEEAKLDILKADQNNPSTRFVLNGLLGPRALLGDAGAVLEPYISGSPRFTVNLAVPTEQGQPFSLNLESTLEGAEVNLPMPLGKSQGEPRPLYISTSLQRDLPLSLNVQYGGDTFARLNFGGDSQHPAFVSGSLAFGSQPAPTPPNGLLVTGILPRWSLNNTDGEGSGLPNWLAGLDVTLGQLELGTRTFNNVNVNARMEESDWIYTLAGDELRGSLLTRPGAPLFLNLEYLNLNAAPGDSGSATTTDPRSLPSMELNIGELNMGGKPVGAFSLSAQSQEQGVRFSRIEVSAPTHRINGTGDWLVHDGGQISRLNLDLASSDIATTLSALGLSPGLTGSAATASLAVVWQDSMPAFALQKVDGTLEFSVTEGLLPTMDPGVGRLFGLLNVGSLTRRLRLDFSDVFEEGLAFDAISGEFTIHQGQAHTENLRMLSPPADILIAGDTDLVNRYYDQVVTVSPKVSVALPVAGAIAGGPAVGAALLLAERILQKPINQAASYQYSITGPWDEPVVEKTGDDDASPQDRRREYLEDR